MVVPALPTPPLPWPPLRFSVWPRLSELAPDQAWRARANSCATVLEAPWPEFAEWLSVPLVPLHSEAGTGSPVTKHEQAYSPLSAIEPGKGGRVAGGPASFLALEYDDSASPEALSRALRLLQDRTGPTAAVVYTTASATAARPRFRVVMPVTEPLVDDGTYASCVDHFGRLVGVRPSPESRQRTRLWYRPIQGARVWTMEGAPWDVAASRRACPPPPPRVPPPAPSQDALAHWPLADRVRQAWDRLMLARPPGAFGAGCVCHDHGVPEDVARPLLVGYATMMGWSFDEADLADRLEHAYEYARDPFGCRLMPSVTTHEDLRQRDARAVGMTGTVTNATR